MCNLSQSDQDVVQAKVMNFVSNQKMFTSVHVANAIKTDGHWVKNSDVACWLRDNLNFIAPHYMSTAIAVSGAAGSGRANLYHPSASDPSTFTDTNLDAMTPDEFKRIHGVDPFAQSAFSTTTVAPILNSQKITLYECVSRDKSRRIRIPASIVKKIGLTPHSKVTDKKFAIKNIPEGLRVHADGRISIPRHCTNVSHGNVKIYLKDNVVGFEQA